MTAQSSESQSESSRKDSTWKGLGRYWPQIAFAVFTVAWGGNEFTPLLVLYRAEDYFNPVFVDSLLASYAVGIALSLWLAGSFSDQVGRKPFMGPALITSFVGSTLIALGEHSEILMSAGSFLSGVAVGIVMSVGSSWLKELSQAPYDLVASPNKGAQRASMAVTSGFACGALAAGVLAQWGPMPAQLTYIVQAVMCFMAYFLIKQVPETRPEVPKDQRESAGSILSLSILKDPRFRRILLYSAPWIFAGSALAYAVMPTLIQDQVSAPVAFSAALSVLTLGVAFLIQKYGLDLLSETSARGTTLSMVLLIAGILVSIWTAVQPTVWKTLIVAVLLGLSYGLGMLSGLAEVERVAAPNRLANGIAVFYALAYIGFFLPAVLTYGTHWMSYTTMFIILLVAAIASLLIVMFFSHKHLERTAKD